MTKKISDCCKAEINYGSGKIGKPIRCRKCELICNEQEKINKKEGNKLLKELLSINLKDVQTKDDVDYWTNGLKEYQKELKEMFDKDSYAKKLYNQNEKLLIFLSQLKRKL